LSLIITQPVLAQIEIQEEIVLDSRSGIESIDLEMPFYGRAKVFISRPWIGSCQWPAGYVCFTFSAGSQSTINGCCDCQPNTNCFSQLSSEITFSNLPMGASVTFTAKSCVQGSWQDVPLYAVQSAIPTTYKLWGNVNGNDPCEFGSITFTAQTPPGCEDPLNDCPSGFSETLSDIELTQKDVSYTTEDECSKPDRIGFFGQITESGKQTDVLQLDQNNDITVCYDKDYQQWRFSIVRPKINFFFVKDICWNNISNYNLRIINSLNEINYLNDCEGLLASLERFRKYEVAYGDYAFIEIYREHENGHKKIYEKFPLQKYINNYYNIPDQINYSCTDLPNESIAKEVILSDFKAKFMLEY